MWWVGKSLSFPRLPGQCRHAPLSCESPHQPLSRHKGRKENTPLPTNQKDESDTTADIIEEKKEDKNVTAIRESAESLNDGDNERQLAGGLAREDSSFSHFLSYHLIPSFQIVFNSAFGIHGMQRKEHSAV